MGQQRYKRRSCRTVYLAGLPLGGDWPILVQSMNNIPCEDIEGNLLQLKRLAAAGCAFSRLAVPNEAAAQAFAQIARRSVLPLVADIHFDWRLALRALEGGAAGLRINPGNTRDIAGLQTLAAVAKSKQVPIRVGVNSGSIAAEIRAKEGGVTVNALLTTALEAVKVLEDCDFTDICVSLKASDPLLMIESYRAMAELVPYPLHLGVTEAGTQRAGIVRSAVGIGTLLAEGIGDTIRVSLTAPPEEEIAVGYSILQALALSQRGASLISCPTCGRTRVDVATLAARVEDFLQTVQTPIKVAVMGCEVNGPGEAREADFGIAGGQGEYLLFAKGAVLRKVSEAEAFPLLCSVIKEYLHTQGEDLA